MTTVAQLIVETLQAVGVRRCYGIPGVTLNHITDAIRTSNIRWMHVRHEEAAGFAAGADAMLTGELAACAGSCGPGSLHFINGLFESHRNRAPVVLIASQIVRDELGFDFPQEVDFKSGYASCSAAEIRSIDEIYPFVQPGELLDGARDHRLAAWWNAADPASFARRM